MAASAPDFERRTDEELVEAAEYAFWLVLADDAPARILLAGVSEALARRGRSGLAAVREQASATVWAALAGLDRSAPFHSQPKMRQLLRLIVGHTLEAGEPIKQEVLGRSHYGKSVFSHQALATEVGRLRDVLSQYYQGEGVADALRIHIPKKRYIAVIRRMVPQMRPAWLGPEVDRTTRSDPRPLNALPGVALFPTFSPDGRIVFAWNHGEGFRFGLFHQTSESSTPTELTSTRLTGDVCPTWSPDGRNIAFLRYGPLRGQVIVTEVSADGTRGRERVVATVSRFKSEMIGRQLAWLPDGSGLLVSTVPAGQSEFSICKISIDGSGNDVLTAPPLGSVGDGDPAVSPDGRALAFVRTEAVGIKDVVLLDLASRHVVRLTSDRKHVHGITWHPRAHSLVIASARGGSPSLWQVRLNGEPPEPMAVPADRPHYPAFSLGGDRLAYTNLVVNSSIWEVALGGRRPGLRRMRRLVYSARSDVNPDVSPDGRFIAFASDRTGHFEIWTCDRKGADPQRMSALPRSVSAGSPRWSPDGRQIVFDARTGGETLIYILDVHGGGLRVLMAEPGVHATPSWSRDGARVYWSASMDGARRVCSVPASGGNVSVLTDRDGLNPLESPDGRWLYFSRPGVGLLRMRAPGGQEELVLESLKPSYWGLWDVTSDSVYYIDSLGDGEVDCSLMRLDPSARTTRLVTQMKGMTTAHYQGMSICPDGRSLLMSRVDQARGEIMIADC